MALLICPDCHEKPQSATLVKSANPLYCSVCFGLCDGIHVKLPCSHTLCIGHYKMMGGEVDETQEVKTIKEVEQADKSAGLSSQAKRRMAKQERKNGDKDVCELATSSSSPSSAKPSNKKGQDASGPEKWFPTEKSGKDGRFLDSTTRAILFMMLVCGISNTYLRHKGPEWLDEQLQNAPQKLMDLPNVLQKSGLSMLTDVFAFEGEVAQPPVNFKTVADGDLSVAEGEPVVEVYGAALGMETAHELAED